MLFALIADTHLPKGSRRLPARCTELITGCDAVVHAGDIVTARELDALRSIGPPVHAVCGNVDEAALQASLPLELILDLGPHQVAVLHDPGPRRGRFERLARRFPQVDGVIFGHTHAPEHRTGAGFQIFNPGSPTERRRAPSRCMGVMRVSRKGIEFEHIELE
jgi:putative phosphoesterase